MRILIGVKQLLQVVLVLLVGVAALAGFEFVRHMFSRTLPGAFAAIYGFGLLVVALALAGLLALIVRSLNRRIATLEHEHRARRMSGSGTATTDPFVHVSRRGR